MFRKIFFVTSCLILFLLLFTIFVFIRNAGKSPTKDQLKQFEKLPYFKDGHFINIYNPIDGFKNLNDNEDNDEKISLIKIIKQISKKEKVKIEKVELSQDSFDKIPSNASLYWLGHSNVILELNGKRIIFDPIFDNAFPLPFFVSRYTQSPIKREELPHIDYVIISHNHYDHMERKTIIALKNSKIIVPLGNKERLVNWGVSEKNIIEVGWGDKITDNNLIINAEPAIHHTQRGFFDIDIKLWNSYVIQSFEKEKNYKQIYFSGDSAYGEHIDAIAKKYGKFDLAMVECDAWNVRWKYFHTFTREVVQIMKQLQVKKILPIHWGVFNLGMHKYYTSINMLISEAKKEKIDNKVLLTKIGEKVSF